MQTYHYSFEQIVQRSKERGLTDCQIADLVHIINSNEIEGYSSLTLDQNIDCILEGDKKFLEGEAYKILGLPVPPDLKERFEEMNNRKFENPLVSKAVA